jgi:uncharacterized protein with HEPN domain
MTRDRQRLDEYLDHILQAITRIESYTTDLDEAGFLASPLVQDAVIRNLEIVGEASRNVDSRFPDFAAAHPELPLSYAYQMRNAVAHGYFRVDLQVVWKTLKNELPGLAALVHAARSALGK